MANPVLHGYCHCGCGERTSLATKTAARDGWVKGEPLKYLFGHKHRLGARWAEEDRGHATSCWIWRGSMFPHGYGRAAGGRFAHIRVWTERNGAVPEGLELDHLCRVKACVNPAHLEPVTHQENTRRAYVGVAA